MSNSESALGTRAVSRNENRMPEIKGQRLYVNLGASQVRRRLKGVGLGVRKVESAGRNQAVIIHTATGDHLLDLKAIFSDVMPKPSQAELGIPVENLRNLGATSAAWLREIGVHTREDLKRFGPVLAYRLVQQGQPRCSLNLLWALAGALEDIDWRALSPEQKEMLLKQVESD